jgi:hypothetical protein
MQPVCATKRVPRPAIMMWMKLSYAKGKALFRAVVLGAAVAISVCSARSATVAVWQTGPADQPPTNVVTIRFQGARSRIDLTPHLTYVLDGESGFAYQLLHPMKEYMRQPLEAFAAASPCADNTNSAPPVATRRSSVIAGYKALEYQVDSPCGRHIFWLAPDYPEWKKFRDENSAGGAKLASRAGFNSVTRDLQGMVVRSEIITKATDFMATNAADVPPLVTNVSTLVSMSVVADDPSLTQVPADYREVADLSTPLPPPSQVTFRAVEDQKARLSGMSSSNRPHMESLAGQIASRPGFLSVLRPLSISTNASVLLGAAAAPVTVQSAATQPGDTYALSMRSWGGDGEQVRTQVITNPVGAKLLWSNVQSGRIAGSSNSIFPAVGGLVQTTNFARFTTRMNPEAPAAANPGQKDQSQ